VVESEARRVELGVGISTNRGVRGVLGYTDQNTFDRGLQLDAQLKIDKLSEELAAGLVFPRNVKGWRYGLESKYLQEDIQNEERTDWSVTGTHAYLVEEYRSQQSLQLLAENRVLADGAEDNVLALYLAQTWHWNQLDDLLAAREGYFLSAEAGGASKDIVSDASFGRLLARGTYLQPIRTFGTLSFRLEGGWVIANSRDNIPGAYLFRTGGDNSVRGYAYKSLGVDEGGSVVGGRYLLVGSVEYTQWFGEQWGAAVFYDAGNANDDASEFRAVAGYGVGVRWHSAIGALNFDVAYGEEVDEFRLHFTTGFVFR
jgi:translocation and assembly module TamA